MTPALLGRLALSLLAAALLCAPSDAAARERRDRHLGPAREIAIVTFPLETILTGAFYQPALAIELRVAVGARFVVTVTPLGVWYAAGGVTDVHGGGVGGRIGVQYYTSRSLAGPFFGLQGGDVEAFIGGRRGRSVGGSFTAGYVLTRRDEFDLSVAVGFGYWHRMGVLDTGSAGIPEIMSLQLGIGWSR